MTLPDKAGERNSGVKLIVETVGDDVLISLKGDRLRSMVFIPSRLIPRVITSLQQIQNEKRETDSI